MSMRIVGYFCYLSILILLSGCATVVSNKNQTLNFVTEPSGKTVSINDQIVGETPTQIKVEKKGQPKILLGTDSIIVQRKIDPWFWGNFGWLLLIPAHPGLGIGVTAVSIGVDWYTGSFKKFVPDTIESPKSSNNRDLLQTKTTLESTSSLVTTTETKKTIHLAVADMRALGVQSHVSQLLTEKLRTSFFENKSFMVMNREDMAKVLDEKNFQRTDECGTAECMAQMGKILGVSKIIAGSVGKLGDTYSITLKVIDIESSRNDIILSKDKKCKEDELFSFLNEVSQQVIQKILK